MVVKKQTTKKHFNSSLTAPGAMSGDRLWVQCCVATTHSHTAPRRPPRGTYLQGAEPRGEGMAPELKFIISKGGYGDHEMVLSGFRLKP